MPSRTKPSQVKSRGELDVRAPRAAAPARFATAVLSIVRRIPPGRVATYGDVAGMAGRPRAARAVGNIMRECHARDVPCHRVVAAGGALGGYGGNIELKRSLLRAEGVVVVGRRIRNFAVTRYRRK
jgi:O-6-methylguanine DNA methyltransferase